MIAILVMTLSVVFWLSRRAAARFVLPIRQLADTAVEFGREMRADGEPSPMLERRDEIGELARSFDRMRFQIVEQFKQIKRSYEKLWETQQALSESEAHYRSLFENVPIGICRAEPGGRVTDANPTLVRMFGYPDKESLLSRPAPEMYVNPQERRFSRWPRASGTANRTNFKCATSTGVPSGSKARRSPCGTAQAALCIMRAP
jgi:PAS domain-containing protein